MQAITDICRGALGGTPSGLAEIEVLLGVGSMEAAEPLAAMGRTQGNDPEDEAWMRAALSHRGEQVA